MSEEETIRIYDNAINYLENDTDNAIEACWEAYKKYLKDHPVGSDWYMCITEDLQFVQQYAGSERSDAAFKGYHEEDDCVYFTTFDTNEDDVNFTDYDRFYESMKKAINGPMLRAMKAMRDASVETLKEFVNGLK